MLGKTGLERLWAGCDTLLLVSVFILLAVVWSSNRREATALGMAGEEKRDAASRVLHRPLSCACPAEGMRVALDRRRVNVIARSMVEAGWDQGPTSPAMDMREDGKTCEVFFTLPEGIVEDSVRVTAAGGVLTLTMKDEDADKIYLQRIRIPYGMGRADTIQTVISNDVLRVRICPAGG